MCEVQRQAQHARCSSSSGGRGGRGGRGHGHGRGVMTERAAMFCLMWSLSVMWQVHDCLCVL